MNTEKLASSPKSKFKIQHIMHDLRSPLLALEQASRCLAETGEAKEVIQTSLRRIKEILATMPHLQGSKKEKENRFKKTNLSELILEIVAEKKIQYLKRADLRIIPVIPDKVRKTALRIKPMEMKRILSNLIDNSAEAINGSGNIFVLLDSNEHAVTLDVVDNGKGIPSNIIPQLIYYGASFGKENGNGIGLYMAKKMIDSWGGNISIQSRVGQGTEVRIEFKKTAL